MSMRIFMALIWGWLAKIDGNIEDGPFLVLNGIVIDSHKFSTLSPSTVSSPIPMDKVELSLWASFCTFAFFTYGFSAWYRPLSWISHWSWFNGILGATEPATFFAAVGVIGWGDRLGDNPRNNFSSPLSLASAAPLLADAGIGDAAGCSL